MSYFPFSPYLRLMKWAMPGPGMHIHYVLDGLRSDGLRSSSTLARGRASPARLRLNTDGPRAITAPREEPVPRQESSHSGSARAAFSALLEQPLALC
ncbi:unnamed protein product [Gadus morhua 'NCC']